MGARATFLSLFGAIPAVVLVFVAFGLVGSGRASTNTAPPRESALPTVTGAAVVGQTLTAASGSWAGSSPISFAYEWQRCDAAGAACAVVTGATSETYLLSAGDVGSRIRVQVVASNAVGSASALSSATSVVVASPPSGAIAVAGGGLSIPAATIVPADRLAVASVRLLPSQPVVGRQLLVRVRVADTAGYLVRGALVSALALPSGLFAASSEVQTRSDGWASVTLRPIRLLPLGADVQPALYVRARRPGDPSSAAASVSTLVPLPLAASPPGNPYAAAGRGYDLSYPDCSRSRPTQAGFAILGVNGGRPFTFNPCLAREYGWYRTTGPQAVYVNTGYEVSLAGKITGACALTSAGLTGRAARAHAIGCSAAASSLERVLLLGMAPPTLWWLDVEPSNRWSANAQVNVAVLRGMIDFLRRLSPTPIVGVYSRPSWWQRITGGWSLAAPEWIPGAGATCATPFSNGPVWLAQGGSSTLDEDAPC
jgi:hypothetical protein